MHTDASTGSTGARSEDARRRREGGESAMYEYAHILGAQRKREMRKRFPVIEKRIGTETVFVVTRAS